METWLAGDGAERFDGAASAALTALRDLLEHLPVDRAGLRIAGMDALHPFLAPTGAAGQVAAFALGTQCRAVRAVLFDKTATTNWALGWHQDRTICVVERRDVEGFGPWTTKQGMLHVAPPFEVLAAMVTIRVHLDDVAATNAPLLVAPGSHRLGRVAVSEVEAAIVKCGTRTCLARAGDIWMYATPILHASGAAARPARRRVLQVDYAARELPGGLQWLGV